MPKTKRTPTLRPGTAKAEVIAFIQSAEAAPTVAQVSEAVAAGGRSLTSVEQAVRELSSLNILGSAGNVRSGERGRPAMLLRVTRKGLRSVEAMASKVEASQADAEVPAAA